MTRTPADDALDRLLASGRDRAATIDAHHARLWQVLTEAAEGGKRFRPALVLATHDALGGGRPAAAAEVGAAVELLHTAFVVHDDVIDGDHVRRGRPNVSGTFRAAGLADEMSPDDAAHYGSTAAVLAGDLALAAAVRAVATCGAPAAEVHRLLDLFDAALHTTAAGELADVRLSLLPRPATLEASLLMEQHKTSAYSFSLPLQAGAVLAGAGARRVEQLGEAGRLLGIAFQAVDDLVGVFGDPARTGKSATNDLRTRKQTPLLVHAATTPEWAEVSTLVGRDLDADELQEVRRLLTSSGSRAFVEDLADRHLAEARGLLAEGGVDPGLVDDLLPASALLTGTEVAA